MKPTNLNGTHRPTGPQLPCDDVLKSVSARQRLLSSLYAANRNEERYRNVISFESYQAQKRRDRKRAARQKHCRFCFISNLIVWTLVIAGFTYMAQVMHNEQQLMQEQLSSPMKP